MARQINRLTAVGIKAKKTPGRYSDGAGLYLYISKTGARSWVFRYRDRTTSKLRDKGLGPLQDVTLEKARERAAEERRKLQAGVDPIDATRQSKAADRSARANLKTFGDCASQFIKTHKASWRNAKHRYQWTHTLETYAVEIWATPVATVDTAAVLRVLEAIWTDKTETATRLRQRIENVLDWATARGYRTGDNPARWRGHLQNLLAAPNKLKTVSHLEAMPYAEVSGLVASLEASPALSAKALLLQILTAVRPGEAIGARWDEFDLDNARWTVPAERMKAHKVHTVPLPPRLLKMLQALPRDASGFLFPGPAIKGKKAGARPMTTAAPLKLLRSLVPGDLTAHGFRSSFRDWAADQTSYAREVAEAALAHTLKDKTEAAYRRTDLLEKRARMMADWERYCFTPAGKGASVTPIGRKKSGTSR